jgi:hypothetical protein
MVKDDNIILPIDATFDDLARCVITPFNDVKPKIINKADRRKKPIMGKSALNQILLMYLKDGFDKDIPIEVLDTLSKCSGLSKEELDSHFSSLKKDYRERGGK